MAEKTSEQEKFVYVGIIVIFIGILTIRVFTQGKKMNDSIDTLKEEGVSLNVEKETENSTNQENKLSLDESFTSPDGKISFNYPSDWQKVENEQMLDIFNPSSNEEAASNIPNNFTQEEVESLEEATTLNQNNKIVEDIFFIGVKGKVPQFSLGVISAQKLNLQNPTIEELKGTMEQEFKEEGENSYAEITKTEQGDDFVTMEVVTYVSERPTFKSKNVGFIKNNEVYLMNFNSAYESWEDFKNEFNLIISSIEFNEK